MPDVTALPRPGDVFAGKYLIERVVGNGKNSLVFVAQHCVTGKRFAIEWLVPRAEHARHDAVIQEGDPEDTPAAVSGKIVAEVRDAGDLVTEADDFVTSEHQVVGHFRHPNVLEVYDVGEAAGSLYTVKEWSDGESLEARLARSGPMSIAEACALLVPCMRGMHEAHTAGILHRDLKPSNIYLCQATPSSPLVAKVLDFEVASEIGRDADAASLVVWRGARDSKPYYRAPEQIGGLEVDHRADVYAFGAILYEVLTGRPPFAPVRYARRDERATRGVPALQSRSERLPPGADAIIGRAMARDVSRRFQSLKELADAFEALSRSPIAFGPNTLTGSPSFDGDAVLRSVSAVPPPLVIEGTDPGTDPGAFTHEASFTRSRPWPRPTRYEAAGESPPPELEWPEGSNWGDPHQTSHVPEWSEPPSMHELNAEALASSTRTDFFVETAYEQRAWRSRGRVKPGYVAGAVALIVIVALIALDRASEVAPEPPPDVVARYETDPSSGVSALELEPQPAAAPERHMLAQPPAAPAPMPARVAEALPAAPPIVRAPAPMFESRRPLPSPSLDEPARAVRPLRSNPEPAAKPAAPARPKASPRAGHHTERRPPSVPAASDDPLPMPLL